VANRIHPTAIIGPDVEIGDSNVIGPYAVVYGPGSIGDDNYLGPQVAIGTPAEIIGSRHGAGWEDGHGGWFSIGNGTVVREFVAIQVAEGGTTTIGNGCYLMATAHIPHDAVVEDHATLACFSAVGGHCIISEGAFLGLSCVLHQRIAVGAGAMVGMGAVVTRHIPPFAMAFGNPSRVKGANRVGLQRRGYSDEVVNTIDDHYRSGVDPNEVFADPLLSDLSDAHANWIVAIERAANS
jgi:UDP-N-acetylglucosamine acyltransferase